MAVLAVPALLGGLAGSALLLSTPGDTFEDIVPFLILFAAVMMLFQERLSLIAANHKLSSRGGDHVPPALRDGVLRRDLRRLLRCGARDHPARRVRHPLAGRLQHSNALKGLIAGLVNGLAAVYFAVFGPVAWAPGLLMGVGSLAGGYLGVGFARKLGPVWLRLVCDDFLSRER